MARIRTIKPEFQQSESMGRVSRDARLLFILLWPICDDEGRTRANPRMLSSVLFPYDEDSQIKITEWLFELVREKCIKLYEEGGNAYLQIESWQQHQRIEKPSLSRIPPPPVGERSPKGRRRVGNSSPLEGKGREGTKDQGGELDSVEPLTRSPPAIEIPTNRQGQEYPVSQAEIDEFAQIYPNVDVAQELREMRGWSIANKAKRKTAGGMPKFINAWLAREQDKNRGSASQTKAAYGDGPIEPTDRHGWQKRLEALDEFGAWLGKWGPKIGEPGCLVPAELLPHKLAAE